jgi:multiple sugar transport system ATP-binding protein
MASVRLENVRKVYGGDGGGFVAVHDATLEVADGELMVLVGPSGCGKTTLLRMIAGLETVTAGRLYIGDRIVNDIPPKERDIAMVFQNYALYPHMSVYDNLAFGLKLRGLPRDDIDQRVGDAARILGLEAIVERKPSQLSGGQRQRVAVGRAIVRQPQVFLFDEPLSNLDAKLRVEMRTEIARLHRRLEATMIYVTHSQVEAMTLGNRIAILHEGWIQQTDKPLALYERPANRFVAGFIGSPAMNFLEGEITRERGIVFRTRDGALALDLGTAPLPALAGGSVTLGVRPEHVQVAGARSEAALTAESNLRLDVVEPMGNEIFLYTRAGEHEVIARVPPQPLPEPGEPIRLAFDLGRLHWFDADSGDRIAAQR